MFVDLSFFRVISFCQSYFSSELTFNRQHNIENLKKIKSSHQFLLMSPQFTVLIIAIKLNLIFLKKKKF